MNNNMDIDFFLSRFTFFLDTLECKNCDNLKEKDINNLIDEINLFGVDKLTELDYFKIAVEYLNKNKICAMYSKDFLVNKIKNITASTLSHRTEIETLHQKFFDYFKAQSPLDLNKFPSNEFLIEHYAPIVNQDLTEFSAKLQKMRPTPDQVEIFTKIFNDFTATL
jgi:hypothetical protein